MARQQTFMDENPLVPQIQNLDAQVLGGPNDPLSENYIDPRIEMRETKRQQQAQYDAGEQARQQSASMGLNAQQAEDAARQASMQFQSNRLIPTPQGLRSRDENLRAAGQTFPNPQGNNMPVMRGIGSMGQGRRR